MYQNLKTIIRVSVGLAILMVGIVGILLPILPGWLLIFVAIPIINPEYGHKAVLKIKEWRQRGKKTPKEAEKFGNGDK